MDNEVEQQFSWIPEIKRGFLKSFSNDYEVGTLELLQKNIKDEIRKVICTYDLKRGKLLFQCIEYFYYHFCRKWYQRKKISSDMEDVWVHIMFSFFKIGLFLSKGNKKSKWVNQVSTAIQRFPGGKNLVYDALLSVNCLNKKYQPAYGSILMCLLVYMSSFVPLIIEDPADYLKMCLLFRRLKCLIKDPAEKVELQRKASKILAPSTLSSWLSSHGFSATWMKRVLAINLQINIFKKIKGEKSESEVIETIRKILLPRICTERKKNRERLHFGLNEVDQRSVEKKCIPDNFNSKPLCLTDSLKNDINLVYDDQVAIKDKDFTIYETEIKNKNEKRSKNSVGEGRKKQKQLEKSTEQKENAFLCKKESEAEFKSKKKKLRNFLSITSDDLSLLKDTSKIPETTKNRKKFPKKQNTKESGSNSTEIKLITNHESATVKLPIIVEEINASECVFNEKECLSKFSGNVNSTASSSESEKSKPTEPELLNSNFETEPIPCITKSDGVEFDKTCDSGIKHTSSSEKPENICIHGKLLSETNSSMEVALKNHTSSETQDICISMSSPLKNSYQDDPNHILSESDLTSECLVSENEGSLSSCKQTNVKDLECKQKDAIVFSPKIKKHPHCINLSEEITSEDLAEQTENLISSNQTSDLVENSRDRKSVQTSETFSHKSKKLSVRADVLEETPCKMDIPEDIPALKVHGSCLSNQSSVYVDSYDKKVEVQKDDHTSFNTDDGDQIKFGESNSEVIVKSKLVFENSPFAEKDRMPQEMPQEKSNSESSHDPPISNISVLKTEEISSEKIIEAGVYNTDCVESKSQIPMEHSISPVLDSEKNVQSIDNPLTANNASQEIGIRKENSVTNSSLSSMNNPKEFNSDSFEGHNAKALKESVNIDIHYQSHDNSSCKVLDYQGTEPLEVKTEDPQLSVKNQMLIESQNLGVKANNIEIQTPNCSIEFNTPNTYNSFNDINSLNTSIEVKMTNSDDEVKAENSFDGIKMTNSADEAKTPNSSAANGLMENVLKLVELASCSENESIRQNILRGYTPSTVKNLSLDFSSCMKNEKPVKCLTFLDISTENDSNHGETRSAYHASESPEFLKYRDVFNDQDDVSKVNFSENKSILKLAASTPSDSTNNTEDEESNSSSDCSSHVSFSDEGPLETNSKNNHDTCVEKEFSFDNVIEKNLLCKDGESDTKELQNIKIDVCTKNKTSKEQMLNPVVYLGKKCDSKTSVNINVSEDLSPILGFRSRDKKINEQEALPCEQILSPVNQPINIIKEIIKNPEEIKNTSVLERDEENSKAKIVKVEIQPSQKDVEESCLPTDQEMNVSSESKESIEKMSKLSEDIRSNKCKDLTVCNKDQEFIDCEDVQQSVKLTSEKDLSQDQENAKNEKGQKLIETGKENFMHSLSMKLRKRPDLAQKSALVNEDCSMLSHDSPAISKSMNLRNRNFHVSSNQKVRKRESGSQNATKRSSKRLKKEVNINLGFDFSELSLNSPKTLRSKNDSSNENSSEFVENNTETPTKNLVNSCRRSTRASVISSITKNQDTDPEGYNLRSRKPVILPGKLKF